MAKLVETVVIDSEELVNALTQTGIVNDVFVDGTVSSIIVNQCPDCDCTEMEITIEKEIDLDEFEDECDCDVCEANFDEKDEELEKALEQALPLELLKIKKALGL